MMKKLVLGCCLALVLSDGECWGMKKSESAPELRNVLKVEVRQRSSSLPPAILSGMKIGEVQFKEIEYPKILDKYKGVPEVENVKARLLEIAKVGMEDPKKLYALAGKIIADNDERDSLFVIMEDDVSYIDAIISVVYERLLELGFWDAHFIASEFYTPCVEVSRVHEGSMSYDGKRLSKQMLSICGQYIEAVNWVKNNFLQSRVPFSDTFRSIIEEVKQEKLPTEGYISWAFKKASARMAQ